MVGEGSGGAALLYLTRYQDEIAALAADENDDFKIGIDIVFKSLVAPMGQIAENAGVDGSLAIEKCVGEELGFGYNAAKDVYEDLLAAGILDPCKVTQNALQNSVSVASLVLTTEALVTELPKKPEAPQVMDPNYQPMG